MTDMVDYYKDVVAQDPNWSKTLDESLMILQQAVSDYDPEQVALSFNGGKDCTVVLHLLRLALNKAGRQDDLQKMKFVHFVKENEFEEIADFRREMEQMYGIEIQLFASDFKREVQRLIDNQGVKAIIMGNRRTDPWSQDLKPFSQSTEGWPQFMRVFPILDWTYSTVWQFLRQFNLPYCKLYDLGFTSLGEKNNSQPNPSLKLPDSNSGFLPAYELKDESLERLSRC